MRLPLKMRQPIEILKYHLKDLKNAETKHRNDSVAAGETRLLC